MRIKYLEETTSTNEYIKENVELFSHLDAVYTMCQTNGRGRLGRTWLANGGIALSIFVRNVKNPMLIPLCAAVALYNTFERFGIGGLGIKWPNDILANGKKLCGILCETAKGGYVVGIGVNNKQTKETFESANLPYATSVEILGYDALSEAELVEVCLQELQKTIALSSEELIDTFSKYCTNLGKMVKIIKNGEEVIAKAVGVSSNGGLEVLIDGEKEIVVSGEVSVRGIYGYNE